ncbi:MAG TPA: YXWGXW repeat-containing protein [Burkholderiaceae bacterium]|nr:YXWGXW repeat-containing protein [Burkholderiaceae bacterium]
MIKKTILGAVIAAGSLIGLAPTVANAQYTAIVSVAPPAPIHEAPPPPRRGYVWAPGHHEWRGNQYVWVQGHWVQDRPGYEYREPRWVQRGDGQWHLVGNNWERRGPGGDRDGDGIANRYDRDRDGDGIPNARDDRPNRAEYARDDRYNRRFGPNGDLDRDGIRNRDDRDDRDRDGDGVRNARDRYPDDDRRS